MLDGLSNIQLPFIQHKQDHVIEGFLAQVSTKNKTIFPFLRLLSMNSLVSLVSNLSQHGKWGGVQYQFWTQNKRTKQEMKKSWNG